jgi:hypothetical protein
MALHATFLSTTPFKLGAGTAQCVYRLVYELGEPEFEYRQKHEMFLSSKRSTDLEPTQPPTELIPEFFPAEKAAGE